MNNISDADTANSLWRIVQETSDPSGLSSTDQQNRAQQIATSLDLTSLSAISILIEQFLAGNSVLTGLDLYYLLERCTPVLLFHTILRSRARNLQNNGLQQTYGDHNRLLVFGIDMLDQSNASWYLTRLAHPPDVTMQDIEECISKYQRVNGSNEFRVCLWVTASLHDYGKLYRRGYGLDAEDSLPICKVILDHLCPASLRPLAEFGIRNHDLIEYVLTGETPISSIRKDLGKLEVSQRDLGVTTLGIIQLVGAASLGEGRITKRKIHIYEDCISGQIIADPTPESRLARLIFGEQREVTETRRRDSGNLLSALQTEQREYLSAFLSSAVLHGWAEVRAEIVSQGSHEHTNGSSDQLLMQALLALASLWNSKFRDHEHIVLGDDVTRLLLIEGNNEKLKPNSIQLLNGSRAAIIGG